MLLTSECSPCIWKTLVSLTFCCTWPHYQEIVKFFLLLSAVESVVCHQSLHFKYSDAHSSNASSVEESWQVSASLRTGLSLRKLLWPRSCPLPRSSPYLITGLSRNIKTLFLCFNTRPFWKITPASEWPMGLS